MSSSSSILQWLYWTSLSTTTKLSSYSLVLFDPRTMSAVLVPRHLGLHVAVRSMLPNAPKFSSKVFSQAIFSTSILVNYTSKYFRLIALIYLSIVIFFSLQLAKLSIYYIMDCFSLTPQFSSTPVSVLAAACVKYTLTKYYEEKRERVLYIFMRILSKEDIDEMNYVEALIYMQLVNMADENYVFKEPYYKYSRRKGNINTDKTVNF